MTVQEIAIKYGVPMPETCKDLNWQNETLLWWLAITYAITIMKSVVL